MKSRINTHHPSMSFGFRFLKENGNEIGLFVQPLTDIHLYSDFDSQSELEEGGDVKAIYVFSGVAIFMLLIACINFINLSTAGAAKRNTRHPCRYCPIVGRRFSLFNSQMSTQPHRQK